MAKPDAIAWTPEMDALLGQSPDAMVAARLGIGEGSVRYRRRVLGVQTYRSTRAPVEIPCANCGKTVERKQRDRRRSRKLYCSRTCADAGQKRRDSDTLRYGPGWKNRRAEIRKRDRTCRSCGAAPTTTALHVHHLVPYRYGGTNLPSNLVALCDPCHHTIEAATDQALAAIQVGVVLDQSGLTVMVGGRTLWRGSVRGAGSPTPPG